MSPPTLPADSHCAAAAGHPWPGPYHDHEYGFPVRDDDRLFERLARSPGSSS
jgi:DNA-3-methyladenine glycosylase I